MNQVAGLCCSSTRRKLLSFTRLLRNERVSFSFFPLCNKQVISSSCIFDSLIHIQSKQIVLLHQTRTLSNTLCMKDFSYFFFVFEKESSYLINTMWNCYQSSSSESSGDTEDSVAERTRNGICTCCGSWF